MFNTTCTNKNRCNDNHRKKNHTDCTYKHSECKETATWGPIGTKDRIYCERCKTQKTIQQEIENYTLNSNKCMNPSCNEINRNKIKYGARGTKSATTCSTCAKNYKFVLIGKECENIDSNNNYDCTSQFKRIINGKKYCGTHANIIDKQNTESKLEVKEESKPEVKEESKPKVKEESKPKVKEESKPEVKNKKINNYCQICIDEINNYKCNFNLDENNLCNKKAIFGQNNILRCESHNNNYKILKPAAKVYGLESNGIRLFCIKHKEDGMINVITKKCNFDLGPDENEEKGATVSNSNGGLPEPRLCGAAAQYGPEKIPTRCTKHKEENMNRLINVCKEKNCNERYTYGYRNRETNKNTLLYCDEHYNKDDMINVSHTLCKYMENNLYVCDLRASFPEHLNGKETYCDKHNINNLPNTVHKLCDGINEKINSDGIKEITKCEKRARYGILKGTKHNYQAKDAEKCFDHIEDGMINMIEPRCQKCFFGSQHQDINIRRKQRYMCYNCYRIEEFGKNSEEYKRFQRKEEIIIESICDHELVKNIEFIWDKAVGGGSRRRPDMLIKLETHNIIIEIDEKQHNRVFYNDEDARILEIYYALESIPLIVIRFNPDAYTTQCGKKFDGLFEGKGDDLKIRRQNPYNKSINELVDEITNATNKVPIDPIKTIYLRYTPDSIKYKTK